jgi:hypothetical protein
LTFKHLKKKIRQELAQQRSSLSEKLQSKPFWTWNIEEHKQEDIKTNGDCCFNHIIRLPQKYGVDKPLYVALQIARAILIAAAAAIHSLV